MNRYQIKSREAIINGDLIYKLDLPKNLHSIFYKVDGEIFMLNELNGSVSKYANQITFQEYINLVSNYLGKETIQFLKLGIN